MITLMVFFYGICLGSFINALVWRMRVHRVQQGADATDTGESASEVLSLGRYFIESIRGMLDEVYEWLIAPYSWVRHGVHLLSKKTRDKQKNDKYSIATGRSMCPACEHELAAKDLIPVLSWVWLWGKCRYCKAPISPQYPLVELLTGGLFAGIFLRLGTTLRAADVMQLLLWLIIVTGLVALALYDAKHRFLPNELLYPLLWLGVILAGLRVYQQGSGALASTVTGILVIWGMFFAIYVVGEMRGRQWIGYGDVRLAVLIGLLAGGPLQSLFVIFFASLLGLIWALPSVLRGKATAGSQLPFGPYLIAATFIVVLCGDAVTRWYFNLLVG